MDATETAGKTIQVVHKNYPILGILGLIFVTLKLTGTGVVANWSWWWVLAPFWAPYAIGLSIIALVFGFVFFVALLVAIFG